MSASVPPLQVKLTLRGYSSEGVGIDIVRPEFWLDGQTFFDFVKDSLVSDKRTYEWRSLTVKEPTTGLVFAKEQRHIGFPFFILPLPRSGESNRNRTIFVRIEGESELYRISITGNNAIAEMTSLIDARANVPTPLFGTDLTVEARSKVEANFYARAEWSQAHQVSVLELRRGDDRDVLSLEIENKLEG
jgi:hypothetical protein